MYSERDTLFTMPDETSSNYKISGNSQGKVLLVVRQDKYCDTDRDFLTNIIKAVKLDINEDCHVLAIGKSDIVIHMLFQQDYENVIIFGFKPEEIGMQISNQMHAILPIGNRLYLFVEDLTTIQNDQAIKTKLWNSLKVIFAKNF